MWYQECNTIQELTATKAIKIVLRVTNNIDKTNVTHSVLLRQLKCCQYNISRIIYRGVCKYKTLNNI